MIELDDKAMIRSINTLLEYLSITIRSKRFNYEVDGYGRNFKIKLSNPMDNELNMNFSTSILKFDGSKSTIDSVSMQRKLNAKIEQSLNEYAYIDEILNYINQLRYEQKYILIKGEILKEPKIKICAYLQISNSTYYSRLKDAKYNLAMLIPEAVETIH